MTITVQSSGIDAIAKSVDLSSATIKMVLVDNTYTYSTSHANLSDVAGSARISTATLAGKTVSNGIFTATSPVTWTSVTNPNAIIGIWMYVDTGVEATSTLLIWYDGTVKLTIAQSTASSATVPIDEAVYKISNSSTLTRISGSGPSTITLSSTGGNSIITISGNTTSVTNVPVNALTSAVPNSAILTRQSGSGPSTIVLSSTGGAAGAATALTSATAISCVSGDTYLVRARSLTANSAISVVAGDTYSVPHTNAGLPISTNLNGGNVTFPISSLTGLLQMISV